MCDSLCNGLKWKIEVSQCGPQEVGLLPVIASTTAVAANMGFFVSLHNGETHKILNKVLSMSACAPGQCAIEWASTKQHPPHTSNVKDEWTGTYKYLQVSIISMKEKRKMEEYI